jgi:isoleucyl-tRNA synthetase
MGFDWLVGRSVHDRRRRYFRIYAPKDVYYRKQRYEHRYPHCWRCAEELVYRLVDEWFISMGELYDKPRAEVTAEEKARSLRYQIMDRVDQINWYPGFGYDREMDWLRNMHDWMISKKRYWGLACPSGNVPNATISPSSAAKRSWKSGPLKAGTSLRATRPIAPTSTP